MSRRDYCFHGDQLTWKVDDCPEVSRRLFWGSNTSAAFRRETRAAAANKFSVRELSYGCRAKWWMDLLEYMALDGGFRASVRQGISFLGHIRRYGKALEARRIEQSIGVHAPPEHQSARGCGLLLLLFSRSFAEPMRPTVGAGL